METLYLIIVNDRGTHKLRLKGARYGREIRNLKKSNKEIILDNLERLIDIEKLRTMNYELEQRINKYNSLYHN